MDIVNEYHKKHRVDILLDGMYSLYRKPVPAIECNDGFRISVQASEYTYCTPRVTADVEYIEFECGFPNMAVPELREWKDGDGDDTQTVYAYVPVEVIVALIEKHGGIKETDEHVKANAIEARERLLDVINDLTD